MYHFFVPQSQIGEKEVRILGSDVNHIKNVLRMKPGDRIGVGNGVDRDYLCQIISITGEAVEAAVLSEEEATELPAKIYLYQGLPKSGKMEWIIQKAVELGVHQIIPVSTRRSIVKLDERKAAARGKRWNLIAESAAKQSQRVWIPSVSQVMSFGQAIRQAAEFDVKLLPYENAEGMKRSRELFSLVKPGMRAAVFIGPEGGFDYDEVEQAKEEGFETLSLGKRILRTETAGMAVLSILGFQLESEGE